MFKYHWDNLHIIQYTNVEEKNKQINSSLSLISDYTDPSLYTLVYEYEYSDTFLGRIDPIVATSTGT